MFKTWLAWSSESHHQKESELKVFDIALQHEFTALSKRISSPSTQKDEQINAKFLEERIVNIPSSVR